MQPPLRHHPHRVRPPHPGQDGADLDGRQEAAADRGSRHHLDLKPTRGDDRSRSSGQPRKIPVDGPPQSRIGAKHLRCLARERHAEPPAKAAQVHEGEQLRGRHDVVPGPGRGGPEADLLRRPAREDHDDGAFEVSLERAAREKIRHARSSARVGVGDGRQALQTDSEFEAGQGVTRFVDGDPPDVGRRPALRRGDLDEEVLEADLLSAGAARRTASVLHDARRLGAGADRDEVRDSEKVGVGHSRSKPGPNHPYKSFGVRPANTHHRVKAAWPR